jgi:hypothetical protein
VNNHNLLLRIGSSLLGPDVRHADLGPANWSARVLRELEFGEMRPERQARKSLSADHFLRAQGIEIDRFFFGALKSPALWPSLKACGARLFVVQSRVRSVKQETGYWQLATGNSGTPLSGTRGFDRSYR